VVSGNHERTIRITLRNEGRGLARFPAVRYQKFGNLTIPNVMSGLALPLWAVSHADDEWSSFRGGANDVVYPGETLNIATLVQTSVKPLSQSFSALTLVTEAICDGMPAHRQSFSIDEIDGDLS
jgi:hypothetical protein